MYKIGPENVITSMNSTNPAALEVEPGSTVLFTTEDWFAKDTDYAKLLYEEASVNVNPATGPVAVKGAGPGDTLVVDILDIKLASKGLMFCIPGFGMLGERITKLETKVMPIEDNKVLFNEKIKIPCQPMIAGIGTAPQKGDIPCFIPGRHGGNLGEKTITTGNRLYLPVFVPGGNLALGDLHAVMGDGEVSDWALEISGEVLLKVSLLKGKQQPWPVVETESDWLLLASAEELDMAAHQVTEAAVDFLLDRTDLSLNDAISILSLIGSLEISQAVNPLKTVRMRIPKDIFKNYHLEF